MKCANKLMYFVFGAVLMIALLTLPVSANAAAPNRGDTIIIHNETGRQCFFTVLLSKPMEKIGRGISVFEEKPETVIKNMNEGTDDIHRRFESFSDTGGLYYNGWYGIAEGNTEHRFNMYLTEKFRVLVYFPDNDKLIMTEVKEPYAIESRFSVAVTDDSAELSSNFNIVWNFIALAVRMAVTIGLELLIALAFRFRGKKQLLPVLFVNIFTQVGLNLGMNLYHIYHNDFLTLVVYYFLWETAVLVVETVAYGVIYKLSKQPISVSRSTVYALTANFVSFVASPFIAALLGPTFEI